MITRRLIELLTEHGWAVQLVDRRFSSEVADVGKLTVRKLSSIPGLLLRAGRAFRGTGGPIIYFVTNRPGSFLIDWLVLRLCGRRRRMIAYIHTVGFVSLAERGSWWAKRVREVLSRFEDVVVLGPSLIRDIEKWVAPEKITVIRNPARSPAEGDSIRRGGPLRLLYLSNLLEEKGVFDFIELATRLTGQGTQFRIAGHPGPANVMARLDDLLRRVDPEELAYVGPVDEGARDDLFVWADALIFPSRYAYEAQPLVLIEAFAAGVPVIAYDVGGVSDLVEDEKTGILVPFGDIDGLVEAVSTVTGGSLSQLARGARSAYETDHSEAVYISRWTDLLNRGRQDEGSS
ncbi:glycosyltransferase family 4 protein [Microbacterium aurantiacum]|uniref:glycosyltransferase family 4 protein n=1 Tax=Microbacterium aurantiacum TaxID=162393 RepID=UPI00403553D9